MKIGQMFPSRYLSAEDLDPNTNTIVTIDRVYPAAARDRGGDGEPEVKWMIRFREYRKPMSLWRNTAKVIAEALGTDDTDHWVGQQIAIFPGTYISFGETKPCINVDKWKPEQTRRPSSALVISNDRRPIPKPAMDRFLGHIKAQGESWDGFLRWTKEHCPDALPMVFGVDLDQVPAGVLPAMKKFLDAVTIAPGESIDQTTGEVMPAAAQQPVRRIDPNAGAPRPGATPAAVSAPAVSEEDIPF